MSFGVRLGPVKVSSRGRVGVHAGPVSAYGGGRGGFVAVLGAALVIGLTIEYWYVVAPALVVGVVAFIASLRIGRKRAVARTQAWLAAPAPTLTVPRRFTDKWFAEHAPALHPGQVPALMQELHRRGWTDSRIAQGVVPHLRRNPYVELEITHETDGA